MKSLYQLIIHVSLLGALLSLFSIYAVAQGSLVETNGYNEVIISDDGQFMLSRGAGTYKFRNLKSNKLLWEKKYDPKKYYVINRIVGDKIYGLRNINDDADYGISYTYYHNENKPLNYVIDRLSKTDGSYLGALKLQVPAAVNKLAFTEYANNKLYALGFNKERNTATLLVYSLQSGALLQKMILPIALQNGQRLADDWSFSKNAKLLATTINDSGTNKIILIDTEKGTIATPFWAKNHRNNERARRLVLSDDGSYLVALTGVFSTPYTLDYMEVWDTKTQQLLKRSKVDNYAFRQIKFADNHRFAIHAYLNDGIYSKADVLIVYHIEPETWQKTRQLTMVSADFANAYPKAAWEGWTWAGAEQMLVYLEHRTSLWHVTEDLYSWLKGYANFKTGLYEEAISNLNSATYRLKDKPQYNQQYINTIGYLGWAFRESTKTPNHLVNSVLQLTKAIELDPQNNQWYMVRQNAYKDQSQYDKAIADLSTIIEMGTFEPMSDIYFQRGRSYQSALQFGAAAEDFRNVIALMNKNKKQYPWFVPYVLASSLEKAGRTEQARPYWEESIQKSNNAQANAWAQYYLGQKQQAFISLSTQIREAGTDSTKLGNLYYDLACLYSLSGDTDEGLQNIKKAFAQKWLTKETYNHLLTDTDLANLKLRPEFAKLLQSYGFLYDSKFDKTIAYATLSPGQSNSAPQQLPEGIAFQSELGLNLPHSKTKNHDAVAVVMGISDYSNAQVPDVKYAQNDATLMRKYLVDVLGFDENNILPRDPKQTITAGAMKTLIRSQLPSYIKAGKSDVFVFYSGHGAPSTANQKAYLVPADADPNFVSDDNAYSLSSFYENLSSLKAKSLTVVIDACFTGQSGGGEMMIRNASPLMMTVKNPLLSIPNATLYSASAGDQVANWYPAKGHGMFTYFFLKGLRGEADINKDKNITTREMETYLLDPSTGVPYWSNREFQRKQIPQVTSSDKSKILVSY